MTDGATDTTVTSSAAAPPSGGRGRVIVALVVSLVIGYLADLGTKVLAVSRLDPLDPPVLFGGLLRLQLIRNPGAAFSMGESATLLLSLLAITALVGCAVWVAPRIRTVWQGIVLGMAMAGIAGNLTDRLFRAPGPLRGHVVDFLSVPHFAIFNVADILLTTAAGIVILWSFRDAAAERRAEKA